MTAKTPSADYAGFEQGPIRPPSEASSLLIRVTRNCPWNHCTFCNVYKRRKFSLRPVEDVLEDITRVHRYVMAIRECAKSSGKIYSSDIVRIVGDEQPLDRTALNAALHWGNSGMRSIFLQDANSPIIKPERLITILRYLKECFPWVERITSYARSHTMARISLEDLKTIGEAGLSRIHIGMETGSDKLLDLINKGVDKATHIKAGIRVKEAGMELSEYIMPGLGGMELSRDHALESADALNQINPDFIRLRTFALPSNLEMFTSRWPNGFVKLSDQETARELELFVETLDGITSYLKSDHILNLFEDLDGRYPDDKPRLLAMIRGFLALPDHDRMVYMVGRRMGIFRGLDDMKNVAAVHQVEENCSRMGVTPENVDQVISELMRRFV